jgi:hypothetical protein
LPLLARVPVSSPASQGRGFFIRSRKPSGNHRRGILPATRGTLIRSHAENSKHWQIHAAEAREMADATADAVEKQTLLHVAAAVFDS